MTPRLSFKKAVAAAWQSRWTPVLVVAALAAGWFLAKRTTSHKSYELVGDLFVQGNPHLREVCLTFDDGPHPRSMDSILATLKEKNVRATFFVVGKMVDKNPDLVRQMMAEGHEVGNHTYTHKRLTQMPLESARQEVAACAASVKRATGADMTLLRPPGMGYNADVLRVTQDMGYVTIHWNAVAADYVPVDPAVITRRILKQAANGSVVLLHDSPDTAAALPAIIDGLRERGYRFVTTTQMLARLSRPVIVASNAYAVKPEPTERLASRRPPSRPATTGRAVAARQKKGAPAPSKGRSPIDAPVWEGVPSDSRPGGQTPG